MRLKNEITRVIAKCGAQGYNWRIHASPIADSITFMMKSYNPEHRCVMNKKNNEATSGWITMKLVDVLREHPNITTKGVIAKMLKFGVEPSKNQVYRANKRALEIVQGSHAKSYSKLSKYAEFFRQNNPETIVKIHYDRPNLLMEPRFLIMFISFKAQKDGFLVGCRPFVSFDGYHLKGMFGGVLLIAVTLDGNNSILSIVYAVVECENKASWNWFF